jgi:hypothetical protein
VLADSDYQPTSADPGILHKKEMLMAGWEHDWEYPWRIGNSCRILASHFRQLSLHRDAVPIPFYAAEKLL